MDGLLSFGERGCSSAIKLNPYSIQVKCKKTLYGFLGLVPG